MLTELYIKDFALIQELRINFSKGLNLITGETGAGKSIILGALNLLLGSRATTDMIKSGAARSVVEGSFEVPSSSELNHLLDEKGLREENMLVLKREITIEGKGRCYVNSQQVPVTLIRDIGRYLVDIHGQNENQNILYSSMHRAILDRYAGIGSRVEKFQTIYKRRDVLMQKLQSVSLNETEKNRRMDLLRHEIKEIEAADLKSDNELDELVTREKLIDNAEGMVRDLSGVYQLLHGEERSILSEVSYIEKILEKIMRYDESIVDVVNPLREASYLLEDVASLVRDKADAVNLDPEEMQIVKERIDLLQNLVRKYGPEISDVKAYLEKAANELSGIELSSDEERKLREEIQGITSALLKEAVEIAVIRKKSAKQLELNIEKELKDLGMMDSTIRISIKWEFGEKGEYLSPDDGKKYIINPYGLDTIELFMSSGADETLRPLRKIASGGEMSRIMLAIKKVIIDSDPVSTLVFDEVDTGVGGRIAEAVGKKLASLSNNAQVFVITHLHQIAGMSPRGTAHYKVVKDFEKGTRIQNLNYDQRVQEVARMIGGETITDSAMRHAQELLGSNI